MIYSLHGRFIHAFPCFCCLSSSLPMPSIYLSNFNLGLSSCMLHHASRLGNWKGCPFFFEWSCKTGTNGTLQSVGKAHAIEFWNHLLSNYPCANPRIHASFNSWRRCIYLSGLWQKKAQVRVFKATTSSPIASFPQRQLSGRGLVDWYKYNWTSSTQAMVLEDGVKIGPTTPRSHWASPWLQRLFTVNKPLRNVHLCNNSHDLHVACLRGKTNSGFPFSNTVH